MKKLLFIALLLPALAQSQSLKKFSDFEVWPTNAVQDPYIVGYYGSTNYRFLFSNLPWLKKSDTASMLSPLWTSLAGAFQLSQALGATSGQVLKWNGSAWAPGTDNSGGGGSTDWADITGKPPIEDTLTAHNNRIRTLDNQRATMQTAVDGKQVLLVSGTNIKTVNGSSLLGSGDVAVSGGQFIGTIYSGTNWANTTGFNTIGAATVTANGTSMQITNGNNTYTRGITYDRYTMLERWKVTGIVIPTDKTATSYGIALGVHPLSAGPSIGASVLGKIDLTTAGTSGQMLILYNGGGGTYSTGATSATNLAFSAGDTLSLSLERDRDLIIFKGRNLTTQSGEITVSYRYNVSTTPVMPTVGKWTFLTLGGTQDIDSIGIESKTIKNPDVLVLGDSKSLYYPGEIAYSWPYLLGRQYPFLTNESGGSMTTADFINLLPEIKQIAPKQTIIQVFRNDVPVGGLTNGQSQTNLTRIHDSLVAWNSAVYFAPFWESTVDLTTMNSWLYANYPSKYINTWDVIRRRPALLTDGVHFGTAGHKEIAELIKGVNLTGANNGNNSISEFTSAHISDTGGVVTVRNTPFPVASFERIVGSNNLVNGIFAVKAILSSGSVADGFGGSVNFQGQRTTADPVYTYSGIGGFRDGADNSGGIKFTTLASGVGTPRATIKSNGFFGVGTETPSAILHASGTTFPVFRAERVGSITTGYNAVSSMVATTTADMTTGYRGSLNLMLRDNANVDNTVAAMYWNRETADNTGGIGFGTYIAGSITERLYISSSGETTLAGGLSLTNAGNKLSIATGTNASIGTATLVAGTVTVSTTAVTASSRIFVTVSSPGGTQGFLSIGTVTAGTSFVINSTSNTETSVVNWWIIN